MSDWGGILGIAFDEFESVFWLSLGILLIVRLRQFSKQKHQKP